jgi:hypothetical protein
MTTLGGFIFGKIILYFLYELVGKGMNYFTAKPDYKKPVNDILQSLVKNKSFVSDATDMIDYKKGIDNSTADKIVRLPYVQTQIIKMVDSTNGKLDETEIENQLKTIFIKSWMDKGITNTAIEKVKKDIR